MKIKINFVFVFLFSVTLLFCFFGIHPTNAQYNTDSCWNPANFTPADDLRLDSLGWSVNICTNGVNYSASTACHDVGLNLVFNYTITTNLARLPNVWVQVATDSGFSNLVYNSGWVASGGSGASSYSIPASTFSPSTTYYWRFAYLYNPSSANPYCTGFTTPVDSFTTNQAPDSSCQINTCQGYTCKDICGNIYPGTKKCNGDCAEPPNGTTKCGAPVPDCTTGTPTVLSGSGPWAWNCSGLSDSYGNTGTSEGCFTGFYPPVNGKCGASNGQNLYNSPEESSLCLQGDALHSPFSLFGQWTWQCVDPNGCSGLTANCQANRNLNWREVRPN